MPPPPYSDSILRRAIDAPSWGPLRNYFAATATFCNEVKGKSTLALSRDPGVQYKTSFALVHKLREAMAIELNGLHVGGSGHTAEIDCGYFGGYITPANHKENRRDVVSPRTGTASARSLA